MREILLENNKELWRQMEERKRLNAAFAHDLRNPVTVLKGCAKLLRKSITSGKMTHEDIQNTTSFIEKYTGRIETYIEAMSNAQKLEQVQYSPAEVNWEKIINELWESLRILVQNKKVKIEFDIHGTMDRICIDKGIVFNVAENIVSNALRFAKSQILIKIICEGLILKILVQDDGTGFSQN